ncbi:hypothetical protein CYCD_03340 [Tenuifilaceae bacterium CYCD]|nr:hypothetical protein CYCD_03340 [Tenuifilaceae bacterium CYCD]
MTFNKIAFTFLLSIPILIANAQEVLVNLSSYPIPQNAQVKKNTSKSKSVLALPFFDDFSRPTIFPTSELWESSGVTSNQNYAINPPSIGVATFDAINNKGELYSTLTTTPLPADTLTSLPINLNYVPSDSVYLSFLIQPQGLGYQPNARDSLVLEFWDNSQAIWVRAWSASVNFSEQTMTQKDILNAKTKTTQSDTLNRIFTNAMLNIGDTRFLATNFKFRFINYASLSTNQVIPGLLSNSDHWHIDMVYLNVNRTFEDTVYNDVAFSVPIHGMMKNFTSIPWKHFSAAYQTEFPNPIEFNITYKNLGPYVWNVSRRFKITDISGSQADYTFLGGVEDVNAFQEFNYIRYFDYSFSSAWADSAKFHFQSDLRLYNDIYTTTAHLMNNDTITSTLEFHNYYALDDGSAESGYGLYGEGTENGMVAYKFHNYKADTLKGALIYFNRTFEDANQLYFLLTVWDAKNGKPNNIIYQKEDSTLFQDSLNKFSVYRIDPTFIPEGDFFMGWTQETQDMLNVGFDRNTNNQNRIFYNISGNWINTQFEGSLMVRPIFGNMYQIPTNIDPEDNDDESEFTIYPNPANDYISFKTIDNSNISSIQIINSTGCVVLNKTTSNLETINVQNLPTGFYIVKACPRSGKCITRKLLIVR